NGTWSDLPNDDRNTYTQQIYGDVGNAVFDARQPTTMANEFTSGFSDTNFENGDPEKWVSTSAPAGNSDAAAAGYWLHVSHLYPSCINQPGDLTGTVYGSDRTGGSMSWLARNKADHGTLWATTSAGRVFVTHNADASDPATVSWHRIDNATSPTRFPSSIYPDPANINHAWVTYSGYNAVTPTTPGHVFNVIEGAGPGSGTFTNLNVEAGTATF